MPTATRMSLRRIAVVDVGSNSVRLVIFDGAARSPAYFYNEKVMAGLGADMVDTGRLHEDGKRRAIAALKRFAAIAESIGAPITAVATAAVRDASDGPAFRAEVTAETGIELIIIDGPEEGRLSAQGILLSWPEADGVVCDMGGSSVEMARLTHGHLGRSATSALGPLRLTHLSDQERRTQISTELDNLEIVAGGGMDRLWLVGGSFRAIGKFDMARRKYPMHVLHEYRASPVELTQSLAEIRAGGAGILKSTAGISASRARLTPLAAEVLEEILRRFRPYDIVISSYGLREGLLYRAMPEELRRRDPLIEAAMAMEARDARLPGFGERLYALLLPLFREHSAPTLRLIRAACLLHDINWRAHPDTRAETCFDIATRANLAGITHADRVFIGLALLYRYSSKRVERFEAVTRLLPKEDQKLAEILGRAMRFGAMFWMKSREEAGQLERQGNTVTLRLTPAGNVLFGEVAKARFSALARALNVETSVDYQNSGSS